MALVVAMVVPRGDTAEQPTAEPRMTAISTPSVSPTGSATPAPSVTAPAVTTEPTATPKVTTPASKPAPTAKPKPPAPSGTPMIIGALSMTIPDGYERTDPNGLQSVTYAEFVGPDQTAINGRYYEPILLRVSSEGIMTIPDDLASLKENECPIGDGEARFKPNDPASVDMYNIDAKLNLGRETYVCGDYTFTYATWSFVDDNGNRFDADYYFIGDRRPAELTEAFKNATLLR